MLAVALFLLMAPLVVARTFLAANIFELDTSCDSDLLQLSILLETGGGCIDHPLAWMPGADGILSYELESCHNAKDRIVATVTGYQQTKCKGSGQVLRTENEISNNDCYSNTTQFSCETSPMALTDKWPAVDIYFGDDACQSSAVTVSVRPGCITLGSSMFSWECSDDGSTMSVESYETVMTCADGVPSGDAFASPTDQCVTHMIYSPLLHWNIPQMFDLPVDEVLIVSSFRHQYRIPYDGYYIIRCNGF